MSVTFFPKFADHFFPALQNQAIEGESYMDYWNRGGVCHIRVGKAATLCGSMIGTAGKNVSDTNCLPCFRARKAIRGKT